MRLRSGIELCLNGVLSYLDGSLEIRQWFNPDAMKDFLTVKAPNGITKLCITDQRGFQLSTLQKILIDSKHSLQALTISEECTFANVEEVDQYLSAEFPNIQLFALYRGENTISDDICSPIDKCASIYCSVVK